MVHFQKPWVTGDAMAGLENGAGNVLSDKTLDNGKPSSVKGFSAVEAGEADGTEMREYPAGVGLTSAAPEFGMPRIAGPELHKMHERKRAVNDPEKDATEVIDDDMSPIEEVNLTVPNTDDYTLPVWTIRVWVLGILSCAVLAFVNQFFWFRTEPLIVSALAFQIITLPLGRFMHKILPARRFLGVNLNPGPFNVKEHVLITIFANCGYSFGNGNAYAIDIVTIMRQFYGKELNFGAAVLLVVTTQSVGYGFAGLMRKFLVEPAHFWWPTNLVNVSLFRTLHEKETGRGMTRIKFFLIAAFLSFIWYMVPGYVMTIMTSLSWICWAFKKSVTAQQVGSGLEGLGLGAFALDWATISAFLLSPLATPWFAIANVLVGFLLVTYVIVPIVYWNNIYDAKNYPILSSRLFLKTGQPYVTSKILDSNLQVDYAKYAAYGKPHLTGFFAITYGVGFATLTATISHLLLWHGRDIYHRARSSLGERMPDIHTRLMQRYQDIPWIWFIILLVVTVGLSIVTCEVFGLQLPWWGVLLATALAIFFTLPVGVIAATTNQIPGLNIITEFMIGFILPGKPIANVVFKTYGYISMTQAISFLQDFKLGQYMKIPPRPMFIVQVVGTLIAGIMNLAVAFWLYGSINNICNTNLLPDGSPWTCPSANVFYSASIIWGVIGPKRIFGSLGDYSALNWFFLAGFLLPVPFWAAAQVFPKVKWLRKVNVPVILGATALLPPATPVNYSSWILTGFIFNYLIFKYYKGWWSRYNYVLSAALDTGVAFMGIIIFAALQNQNTVLSWWGNGGTTTDHCPLASCPTAPGIVVEGCPVF
ncbi:oligopeptide transporter [Klebsormidium nitens]|uniref:Oligopeptide transporter n=1 Tax=Klebsormidium nitens TaxID=105231 RepID=A0A1Y1IGG0_KLENI|nr:oligopeptide transporter [Klebsormidium nitens]|eukprot:GAQ89964.1 oligopeptide transporter [Klebsormidium nitens]